MQRTKYAPEFKDEAVTQVVVRGHSVVDVAKRLDIPEGLLYTWVGKFKKGDEPVSNDLKCCKPRWQGSKLSSDPRPRSAPS